MKKEFNLEDAFKIKDEKTGKKIVYITADKSAMKYAHTLQTLISELKNVKCCIYTKEVYEHNMAKASSDNLIIFIGQNNISSQTIKLIESRRSAEGKYGVNYGYIGTRAVLWRKSIFWNFNEKKNFYKYYQKIYSNFQQVTLGYNAKKAIEDIIVGIGLGLIGLGVKKLLLENISKNKKIKEAQYNACIMEFINSGLQDFIKEV